MSLFNQDTITALSTANGAGAIAVIRISGEKSFSVIENIFKKGKKNFNVKNISTHTAHFGTIEFNNSIIDEVVVTLFKAPNSYTGEDIVEIACHGSSYIQKEILNAIINHGARLAKAGEFTQRAFFNGKLDLSQAEAVADLIASENKAQHEIALKQMRGGFSSEIKILREQLINFAALIELELDFSEEDVEFANRKELHELLNKLTKHIKHLISSFAYGNVIKDGVPVAIVGKPNAGKSSLLNALLNEERAIVSDIAGTTRDTIEDTLTIEGIKFRFIDTAGLRETDDQIEAIGVEKAKEKIEQAKIMLYLFDRNDTTPQEVIDGVKELYYEGLIVILVENKIDIQGGFQESEFSNRIQKVLIPDYTSIYQAISTHNQKMVEGIKFTLRNEVQNLQTESSTIITNIRHKDVLEKSLIALQTVKSGLQNGLSGDLLAQDIRESLKHLGEITGEIDVDKDILGTIFGKFCIGK